MLMDAAVVVDEDGVIFAVHDMKEDGAEEVMAELMSQGVELADFRGKLIMPGFVDGHAHAPQVSIAYEEKRCSRRCIDLDGDDGRDARDERRRCYLKLGNARDVFDTPFHFWNTTAGCDAVAIGRNPKLV